jgi:hypothetical protein
MNDSMKTHLVRCALALCLGAGASAYAAPPAMSKPAYKAAGARIEAQQKADSKACARLKGNARDVCAVQAKGKAEAAQAELDARYKPSPNAERDAKEAQADADYRTAKERCAAAKDKARGSCLKQAKAARDAAVRQAKVEKVETVAEEKAKHDEHHKAVTPQTPTERFAAAKARCEMQGLQRDSCLAEAKRKFGRS